MTKKNIESIFQVSALLILFAAVFYLFKPEIARFVMIAGVAGYTITTFLSRYKGTNLRAKRLFNIQVFAVLMMIAASYLMFEYINEWVVLMFTSGILTFYCSVMLSRTLKDEEGQKK